MTIQSCTTSLNKFFATPGFTASTLREASLQRGNTCSANGLGARFLFVAQIIPSIVAISFLFLAMLATSMFFLCIKNSGALFKKLVMDQIAHLALIIICILSTIAPHSAKIGHQFFNPERNQSRESTISSTSSTCSTSSDEF